MPKFSMLGLLEKIEDGVWRKVENIITGFFAIIPQFFYLLYASVASLLDFLQLVIRKLAGLDSYYVKVGSSENGTEKSGDILKEFIESILGINNTYSALSTVFWSLVIFGVIVLILSLIFSLIKAHYNYDSQKSQPMAILKNGVKALFTMAITPVVVLFGLYLSEIMLKTLDQITNSSASLKIDSVFEREAMPNIKGLEVSNNEIYYASYDMFLVTEWTNTSTFSGLMFDIVASSCNRVRNNDYTATKTISNENWDNCGIFYANTDYQIQEKVATQIDFAFSNCLTLQSAQRIDLLDESAYVIASTLSYGPSAAFAAGLISVENFSKFNVGLVWYYYNLWAFNYLLGFIGIIVCLTLIGNIVFGLMKRLFLCVCLFLVSAPVIGITPLDEGNGFKEWRKIFVSYLIAGFGAVIGMNLFFLLLPFLQSFQFFGNVILDKIFNMLVIICGLVLVKKLIAMLSSFVGATNLEDDGTKTKKAVGDIATKALKTTMATASLGIKLGGSALRGGVAVNSLKSFGNRMTASKMVKNGEAPDKATALDMIEEKEEKIRDYSESKLTSIFTGEGNGKISKFGKSIAGSTAGKAFLSYTGISPGAIFEKKEMDVLEEDGTTVTLNAKETRIKRGEARLKNAFKNTFDITGKTFKAVGDLTGLSKAFKTLEEKGVVDEGKLTAQSFFQAVGMENAVKEMQGGLSDASTSKQLEKSSQGATKKKMEKVKEMSENSKRLAEEIFLLTEKIKRK